MDFAKEEANLVYEERFGGSKSPDPHEDSEEDEQRELEEMLYSHVYYDDSSINAASPEAATSPSTNVVIPKIVTKKVTRQLGFASSGIEEPTSSAGTLELQFGCNRSQFNHPSRFKASRYYDDSGKISKSTFVAPRNPNQRCQSNSSEDQSFTRPSEFITQLMARSAHERSYKTKVLKPVSFKEAADVRPKGNSPPSGSPKKSFPELPKVTVIESGDSTEKPTMTQSPPSSSSLETSIDSDHSKDLTTNDESEQQTPIKEGRVGLASDIQNNKDNVCVKKGEVLSDICKEKSPKKRSHDLLSENSPRTRKLKQQSFEAKVSKVLSSMLDEESRSSIDETPPLSSHANQNLKNPNLDSSWSVGMSWADMSSKYSFGVDSIEEESVSSLQLQEVSSNADSRTHTPDIPGRPDDLDKDEESTEPSRYQILLKVPEKDLSAGESDSASEVDSVVEVAPPVKPPPPVVDLSDGEYVPVKMENKKSIPNKKDVTVLFTKQKDKRVSSGDFIIESSSDDDLVILDVIDNSKQRNDIPLRAPIKRRSLVFESLPGAFPSKRLAISQTTIENNSSIEEQQLIEAGPALLEKPIISKEKIEMEKLDKWLNNPIKSSKYLDHGKILKNMSDDPKLWQLCQADVFNTQSSGYGPKCINCNQFGHKKKFCPAPQKLVVCHMCGVHGHSEPRCPNRMCLRCGERNNIYTDRCNKCVSFNPCKICESKLHEWKSCPDLWRRYHLTTTPGEICKAESVEVRPRNEHWCSNCAGKYHLSHECTKAQWKCESISPYIRSYMEANDQEQKIEGPTEMTMLLSDDCAEVLSTSEGKEFLDCLASDCKINIHSSLDITYKKLNLKGTSVNLVAAREKIKVWCQQQKIALAGKALPKKIEEIKTPPHKCPNLPKKADKLATVLIHQLQLLESQGVIDKTVQQLYDSLIENLDSTLQSSKDERAKCNRFLNMILLGKCGFKKGDQHLSKLKICLGKIKKVQTKEVSPSLYKEVLKHFQAIFGYCWRPDWDILVKRFYDTNDLVQKFDYRQDKSADMEPTNSGASSSQKAQLSKTKMKKQSVIKRLLTPQLLNEGIIKDKKTNSTRKIQIEELLSVEKGLKQTVPRVLENLASRFIMGRDRKELSSMFLNFCDHSKMRGTKKINFPDDIQRLKALVEKCRNICRKYKIKVNI